MFRSLISCFSPVSGNKRPANCGIFCRPLQDSRKDFFRGGSFIGDFTKNGLIVLISSPTRSIEKVIFCHKGGPPPTPPFLCPGFYMPRLLYFFLSWMSPRLPSRSTQEGGGGLTGTVIIWVGSLVCGLIVLVCCGHILC